jgi:hypothetical protein
MLFVGQFRGKPNASNSLCRSLLSEFTQLIAADDNAVFAWNTHEEGAMALVRYRGLDQLKSPLGVKLLREVYLNEVRLHFLFF